MRARVWVLGYVAWKLCVRVDVQHMYKRKKIFPIVWQVTEALELFDVKIVSLTSDGEKRNRRFCRLSTKKEGFSSIQKGEGAPDSDVFLVMPPIF